MMKVKKLKADWEPPGHPPSFFLPDQHEGGRSAQRVSQLSAAALEDPGEEIRADPVPAASRVDGLEPEEHEGPENEPKDDDLHQQRLPAWTPIHRPIWVIGSFVVIGALFLLIGGALLAASHAVFELQLDYSACQERTCDLSFALDEAVDGPFLVYYGVRSFWQNHRRYWKSKSDDQLLGDTADGGNCRPYEKLGGKVPFPCGAIPNSLFADDFILKYRVQTRPTTIFTKVETTEEGIDWPSLRRKYDSVRVSKADHPFPVRWHGESFFNDLMVRKGIQEPRFSVWMSQAAFPSFRKPWAKIDPSKNAAPFNTSRLPAGNYSVEITNRWNISAFDGEKRWILSSYGWAGGRNPFLAVAYLGTGAACLLASVAFSLLHWRFGMTFEEMSQNVGNRKDTTWRW